MGRERRFAMIAQYPLSPESEHSAEITASPLASSLRSDRLLCCGDFTAPLLALDALRIC
jgi:hypothetical protein